VLRVVPGWVDCNSSHDIVVKTGINTKVSGKIKIDTEKCKGCGLCVEACPKNIIAISKHSNKNGYFPAEVVNIIDCFGCALCAIMCPDTAIEVYCNIDIVAVESEKKDRPTLSTPR
jgi:2-oxoglutarate ferredoxin oxidoreductase subunit delta